MNPAFDHEKLAVYQKSIEFIVWSTSVLECIPKSDALHDQLDRAATSIPLNIAEGNGKWTPRDRCRYFDSARGSALECSAALDVAEAKKHIDTDGIPEGKETLAEIVRMLIGLIKANDSSRKFGSERVGEEISPSSDRGYESSGEQEQE